MSIETCSPSVVTSPFRRSDSSAFMSFDVASVMSSTDPSAKSLPHPVSRTRAPAPPAINFRLRTVTPFPRCWEHQITAGLRPRPGPARREAPAPRRPRASRASPTSGSIGPGAHQFQSPSSFMVAGTSRARTTVASMSSATSMPMPIIFMKTMPDRPKAPMTTASSSAALVMIRPVFWTPVATAQVVVVGPVPLLADPGEQEHLVVHRQPEQDGQHQDRVGRVEVALRLEAEQAGEVALLEDPGHDPEGRGDRDGVHHDRLERQHHGAEGQEQQHQHHADHDQAHPRQVAARPRRSGRRCRRWSRRPAPGPRAGRSRAGRGRRPATPRSGCCRPRTRGAGCCHPRTPPAGRRRCRRPPRPPAGTPRRPARRHR